MEKPKSIKRIVTLKKRSFWDQSTVPQNTVTLGPVLQILKPNSVVTPLELDWNFGLFDEPSDDEQLEFFFAVVDIDNLPPITSIRHHADAYAAENWILVGVAASANMVLDHMQHDFLTPKQHSTFSLESKIRRFALAVVYYSTGVNSSMTTMGTAAWQEEIYQPNWRSDNSFSDLNWEEEVEWECNSEDG